MGLMTSMAYLEDHQALVDASKPYRSWIHHHTVKTDRGFRKF